MTGAVIFDLDDTLYDYKSLDREADKRVQDFVCNKLGIDETRMLIDMDAGKPRNSSAMWVPLTTECYIFKKPWNTWTAGPCLYVCRCMKSTGVLFWGK